MPKPLAFLKTPMFFSKIGDSKVRQLTADILVTSFVSIICVRFKGFDAKRHLSREAPLYWL